MAGTPDKESFPCRSLELHWSLLLRGHFYPVLVLKFLFLD